ncbi:MAG: VCBS repeat-containing protein [bacterium]|nr:VCBS repeat-containing protein [bacterium]
MFKSNLIIYFVAIALLVASNASADIPLEDTPCWMSTESDWDDWEIGFGDMNNDGYPELAVSVEIGPDRVYRNIGGQLETTASWVAATVSNVALAWGDVNNDGYQDLAVAYAAIGGGRVRLYMNNNGELETTPSWTSEMGGGMDISFGDMNGDGWLDLATTDWFYSPNVYLNLKGVLETRPSWQATDLVNTSSCAWGDVDNDGKLDLAVGRTSVGATVRVYFNQDTILETAASWLSEEWYYCTPEGMAFCDVNNDGWLDLGIGNTGYGDSLGVVAIYI